jgi:hypothetical protein
MSLEMAHKVIVPQKKKIMSHSFLNSGTLIVIANLESSLLSGAYLFNFPAKITCAVRVNPPPPAQQNIHDLFSIFTM